MKAHQLSDDQINKITQEAVELFEAIIRAGATEWPGIPDDEDPDREPAAGWGVGIVVDNDFPFIDSSTYPNNTGTSQWI